MDLLKLQEFFLWLWIVNFGLYGITVLAVIFMRNFVIKINMKMFDLDEQFIKQSIYKYIANFKLLTMIFTFTPWLALVIINS